MFFTKYNQPLIKSYWNTAGQNHCIATSRFWVLLHSQGVLPAMRRQGVQFNIFQNFWEWATRLCTCGVRISNLFETSRLYFFTPRENDFTCTSECVLLLYVCMVLHILISNTEMKYIIHTDRAVTLFINDFIQTYHKLKTFKNSPWDRRPNGLLKREVHEAERSNCFSINLLIGQKRMYKLNYWCNPLIS